jgi:predicted ATPase
MRPYLSIALFRNLLSFGPDSQTISLQNLNILIGPNGSGKSNFISLIELMANSTDDLMRGVNSTGGTDQWIHFRGSGSSSDLAITLSDDYSTIRYAVALTESSARFTIESETVTRQYLSGNSEKLVLKRTSDGAYVFPDIHDPFGTERPLPEGEVAMHSPPINELEQFGFERILPQPLPSKSILSQGRTLQFSAAISTLFEYLESVAIYSQFDLSPTGNLRLPQPPGSPERMLLPDLSNLPHMVAALKRRPETLSSINEHLSRVYPDSNGLDFDLVGAYLQVYLKDKSGQRVSAFRLSDGTLRFICLLTILLNPDPPPLICIEEPDIGLHPDAISELARVLREASRRTQLIITTHCEQLVSAFSDEPEAILVASRDGGGTAFRRLESEKLSHWLEDYSLGDLWMRGQIGGTL